MHRYKRQSAQAAIVSWAWKRKLPLAAFMLAAASWSRLDRAATRDDLAAVAARIEGSPNGPRNASTQQTLTVRAVGAGGIIVADRGIVRPGDDLFGWTVLGVERGAARLSRGDSVVMLRSGSVFDPASGAVTR